MFYLLSQFKKRQTLSLTSLWANNTANLTCKQVWANFSHILQHGGVVILWVYPAVQCGMMGDPRHEQQIYDNVSSPMLASALKTRYPPGSKLHPTTFSLKASLYLGATDISPLLRMMPSVGDEPQCRKVTQHRFFLAASQTKHWADFFFVPLLTALCRAAW